MRTRPGPAAPRSSSHLICLCYADGHSCRRDRRCRSRHRLFQGRRGPDQHLTTQRYARLVSQWVSSIGLDPLKYATHSMRRTKATLIYRRTKNLRAVQLLLGHSKLESTVRYLGIEVDDALEISEQTEI